MSTDEVDKLIKLFLSDAAPASKLQIEGEVTAEVLEKQFRRLSARVHPDRCDRPNASDAFALLTVARDKLAHIMEHGHEVETSAAPASSAPVPPREMSEHEKLARRAETMRAHAETMKAAQAVARNVAVDERVRSMQINNAQQSWAAFRGRGGPTRAGGRGRFGGR